MIIRATARPRDDYDAEPRRWDVQADDYDTAMEQVRADLPDGWVLMSVRVER